MHKINRLLTNICSADLPASKAFYVSLFELEVAFDSDWYVQLTARNGSLELGIIDRKNELVPPDFQTAPSGFYLTIVVEDADQVYRTAQKEKCEIIQAPQPTSYGQKRMLLKDPDGTLLDVSSPIPDFQF